MPTKSVVRIDGNNGVGIIIKSAAAGSDSTPSSLSTAASDAGGDNVATGQNISAAKSEKNNSSNDTTTTKESQEDEDNENQEVCNAALAELVSPSTTRGGQSPATKLPRREDFNSALEYLEAKYVKSIAVEDESTDIGAGNGEGAVKGTSKTNEVNKSDSDDQMMEDKSNRLEENTNGQNSIINEQNSKETGEISFADGFDDDASFGSGEEKIVERMEDTAEAEAEEETRKLLVESVVKEFSDESLATCNASVPPIAADAAVNDKTAASATDDGPSPSESKNQNDEATTNVPTPHQYPPGYGAWPQFPPQSWTFPSPQSGMMSQFPPQSWPFPPPPPQFGMMYPPYPPPPSFLFGEMPPFVPQPQAQVRTPDNQTVIARPKQDPAYAKKKAAMRESRKKPAVDRNSPAEWARMSVEMLEETASKTAKNTERSCPPPALPPVDDTAQELLLPSAVDQSSSSNHSSEELKVDSDSAQLSVIEPTNAAVGIPVPALPPLPSDARKMESVLDQVWLVERTKRNVEQEMLSEKASKTAENIERSRPPPALPPVGDATQELLSTLAADQSFSSNSCSKGSKVNSDSAQLSAVEPTNAAVGIHAPALPPLPPSFVSTVQDPTLPSATTAAVGEGGASTEQMEAKLKQMQKENEELMKLISSRQQQQLGNSTAAGGNAGKDNHMMMANNATTMPPNNLAIAEGDWRQKIQLESNQYNAMMMMGGGNAAAMMASQFPNFIGNANYSGTNSTASSGGCAAGNSAAIKKAKTGVSDSLVEKAKRLVEEEMLAEKGTKKKAPVEDDYPPYPRPATPPLLPSASAVDNSSTSSSKKRRLNNL